MRAGPRFLLLAVALAVLSGGACREGREGEAVPTWRVERGTFEIRIEGRGILEPEASTTVSVPTEADGSQRIAWLAPDGTRVAEGDVVARLDGRRLAREIFLARSALRRAGLEIRAREREIERERRSIRERIALLEREEEITRRYAPADPEVFSRQEILSARIDLDLLRARRRHLAERLARFEERAGKELEILRLRERTRRTRLEQLERAREALVLRAPHGGRFLRARGRHGRLAPGDTRWPGSPVGRVAREGGYKVKAWVLESEAGGLEKGQPADVFPGAAPGRSFAARVASVGTVAATIDWRSPVRYFQVELAIEDPDPAALPLGGTARVVIHAAREENVIAVPVPALFVRDGKTYARVRGPGGRFVAREVRTGRSSLARTVVLDGLREGEVIALADPDEEGR